MGTGQLVMRAIAHGAKRVIVGCGGSATTDGGAGAVEAIGSPDALRGVELVAACDVTTTFVDAARVFAPQKGANAQQVEELTARLVRLADRYKAEFGFDVTTLPEPALPEVSPGDSLSREQESSPASNSSPISSASTPPSRRPTW